MIITQFYIKRDGLTFITMGDSMRSRFLFLSSLICLLFFIISCGGGGGSSTSDSGTVTMSVTDAKPALPEHVSNLFVTFSEVWVHKPREGWIKLGLAEALLDPDESSDTDEPSYTIDLLQFSEGNTTELVPPTELSSGKYTQVRIVVESAVMRFELKDEEGIVIGTEDVPLEIPSECLKTDKNFTIDLGADSAMDIVIHFDLGMSVVASGPDSDPTYSLKPVIHLFEDPMKAATINGKLSASSFVDTTNAKVTVFFINDENVEEEFTRLEVEKDTTLFSIYWLVPNRSYKVQIDFNPEDGKIDFEEIIQLEDLGPGDTFDLYTGGEIL